MKCFDPDSTYSVFAQVIRFHHHRMHMLLEKIGIYPGQHRLLFALSQQDGQSQKDLAEKLHIKAATITIMIQRMEKAQFVERKHDLEDQRVSSVYLTEKGKQVRTQVKDTLKEIETECFTNFTQEEQMLLRRLLMQMQDNLIKVCGNNIYNNT
jgi:MarR family transcriptional regulator, organic hydroperoxide resistance regulator